jgi:hypothetical protein
MAAGALTLRVTSTKTILFDEQIAQKLQPTTTSQHRPWKYNIRTLPTAPALLNSPVGLLRIVASFTCLWLVNRNGSGKTDYDPFYLSVLGPQFECAPSEWYRNKGLTKESGPEYSIFTPNRNID